MDLARQLRHHKLNLFYLFQGKSGLAAQRMFELMTDGPPVVAVIGPTLSPELTVVGQITPFYNVVQVIIFFFYCYYFVHYS